MSSLSSSIFTRDVFKPREFFTGGGRGNIPYNFFITSLGNNFVTSDGKDFKVKNG